MTVVELFARTLDQELMALLRGVSLECLVCGEFVMHANGGAVFCPECGCQLASEEAFAATAELQTSALQSDAQAG